MDPTPPLPAAPPGELVVHNGRLSGTRRALNPALTLIGRAEGCDIRLNVEGVHPFHCALVHTPAGLVLRNFDGCPGTLLNGHPVAEGQLADGDVLAVGPFQFVVRLSAPVGTALEHEKEALRIQAAAVAAQQAALVEEENKLQQRRIALERQEAQLAAHLDERRRHLVRLHNHVRQARKALGSERAAHEQSLARAAAELAREREALTRGNEQLQAERQRLADLYRRLRRRHVRQRQAERTELRRREEALAEERRRLEQEKSGLVEARLRLAGDTELGRRQIQDGWRELHDAQRRWQERLTHEQAELHRQRCELEERVALYAQAEQTLADQKQLLEETRVNLQREAEGLEARVRNLRRKLQELEAQRCPDTASPTSAAEPAPARPAAREDRAGALERLPDLERMAAELEDQRLHLLEQCERVARAEQLWRKEHAAALAELETVAARLQEREDRLAPREAALGEAEAELRRRQEEAAQTRAQLDAWQARLTTRTAGWEAERETLLAEVRQREQQADRKLQVLARLRQKWAERRRCEVEMLQAELQRCEDARRQYVAQWERCARQSDALDRLQRGLAEKALAMEQYRLELAGRSANSAAADRRLKRLQRRAGALIARAARNLTQERQALAAEAARVNALAGQLAQQAETLARREADLSRQQAECDLQAVESDDVRARRQAEVQILLAHREQLERQLQELRDEVERLARLLIDDGPTLVPLSQAA